MSNSIKENFIKERINAEEKYISLYDTYRFNYNNDFITPKFYSKYEKGMEEADSVICDNLRKHIQRSPRDKPRPETENKNYGWFTEPLVYPKSFFWHPRSYSKVTKIGLILLKESKHEPKFAGIPFKLQ